MSKIKMFGRESEIDETKIKATPTDDKYTLFVRRLTDINIDGRDCPISWNPCYLTIFVYSKTGEKFSVNVKTGRLMHSFESEIIPEDCTIEIPKMLYNAILNGEQI